LCCRPTPPRHAPLALVATLWVLSLGLLAVAGVIASRLRHFAWSVFRRVFAWALLAYVIEAGVIEFAFIRDHVVGSTLVVVTGMLLVFALSVATTIAVTVARYSDDVTTP
jgi:hypothetical protein